MDIYPFSSKTQNLSTEATLVSIFAIQRQSIPIMRRDEYGHLPPLVEDSMSFDQDRYSPLIIQRQAGPMVCGDDDGHPLLIVC